MLTMNSEKTRRSVSAVAAMAIVAFAGLTFDQAHLAAAPLGTVEVGELTPVGIERLAQVALPEIVITARRQAAQGPRFASAARADRVGAVSAAQ